MRTIEARARITAEAAGLGAFKQMAAGMKNVAQAAKALEKVRPMMGWGDKFQTDLDKMKLTQRQLEAVQKSWERFWTSIPRGTKAATAFDGVEQWKSRVLSNLRVVQSEYEKTARAQERMMRSGGRFAAQALGVGGAAYVANRAGRASITAAATGERESARNYLAGMTPDEDKQAQAVARQMSAKYGSLDSSQIMERIRSLRSFTGSMDKGLEMLDDHLKGLVVLQSLKGKDSAMQQMQGFTKGMDILGKNESPKAARDLTDATVKAMGVDQDVDMGALALFARYSKSAGAGLSNEFLGAIVPTYMQDMGGPQLGTALGTEVSQVISGRGTKASKAAQTKYGLRNKNGIVGSDLILSNPYEWAQKYLPAAMKRAKLDATKDTDVQKFMGEIFSAQTVSNLFTKFLTQRDQAERNKKLFAAAPGLGAANKLPDKDPFVAYEGLLAQMRTFTATLADPLVPAATATLNALSAALGRLTKLLAENPNVATGAAATTGVVGTAAAGWAGAMLIKKGWGWLRGGASAAAVAEAGIAAAGGAGAGAGAGAAGGAAGGAAAGAAAAKGSGWMAGIARAAAAGAAVAARASATGPAAILGAGVAAGHYFVPDDEEAAASRARRAATRRGVIRGFGDQFGPRPFTLEDVRGALQGASLGGPVQAELRGSAEVKGEATVRVIVEPSGELLRVRDAARDASMKLNGSLRTDGPGSTGKTLQEASPGAVLP